MVMKQGQSPDPNGRRSRWKVERQRMQVLTLLLRSLVVDRMSQTDLKFGEGQQDQDQGACFPLLPGKSKATEHLAGRGKDLVDSKDWRSKCKERKGCAFWGRPRRRYGW